MNIRRIIFSLVLLAVTASGHASGIPNKFTPGNYFTIFPHNQSKCHDGNRFSSCPFDEVTNDAAFQGAQVIYLWKDLEPTKDRYDFSQIEKDLAYLSAKGKRIFIQIQDVWFRNEAEFYPVPDYIRNSGGMLPSNGAGYVAKRWDSYVASRFAKLITKLGQRFDREAHFEGINLPETGISLSSTNCSGYSAQSYYDQLVKTQNALSQAFPNTVKLHYITHWPNCGGDRKFFIPELQANAKKKGIGYGGPDLVTKNSFLNETVYPSYADVVGTLPLGMSAQPSSFNKGLTVLQMLKHGMEDLSLDYIFWSRSNIKTTLNGYVNPVRIVNDGSLSSGKASVRMISGTSNALIYYSQNGSNPNLGSTPLFGSTAAVPQGTTLKAIAYLGSKKSIVSKRQIGTATSSGTTNNTGGTNTGTTDSGTADSGTTQPAPAPVTNNDSTLLPDADFEGSNLAWSGITCGQSCVIYDSSRNSNVLSMTGNNGWLAVKQTVAIIATTDYEISAFLKTVNISKNARISYRWFQGSSALTAKSHFGITSGTTPYTNYSSGVITAPANATHLEVILKINQGYGTAYFDNISLVESNPSNGSTTTSSTTTTTTTAATTNSGPATTNRVTNGLAMLYDFEEGTGNRIYDQANTAASLDLVIQNPANVRWTNGGLSLDWPTQLASEQAATQLVNTLQYTRQMTFEAWVTDQNSSSGSINTLISLSDNGTLAGHDVSIRSNGYKYSANIRTTLYGENLMTPVLSETNSVNSNLTHVVFSCSIVIGNRNCQIYLNGAPSGDMVKVKGNPNKWEDFALVLGGLSSGNNAWLGEFHLVAVYSKALSAEEVLQNFSAGKDG